ncbi:hypothetical protein R3P38DRAFT_3215340 [Favolaschia claudopus]|uniref:Uncharacterized protein n=1 Tax=Favolaschia claudopus TaxID=2862362 RepID=A0AAW0A963_9AGAR
MPCALFVYAMQSHVHLNISFPFLACSSVSNRGSTGEIGEAAAKTASNFGTVPMAVTIVSVVLLVLAIVAAMYKYNEKHPWKGADET